MSPVTLDTAHTPEDLLTMPDGDRYELVGGQLVERRMSLWSSYVAGNLLQTMKNFCDANRRGWVLPEGTSYQCFPDAPDQVRRPHVSFIRLDRMSTEQASGEGHVTVAPDLAVVVVSPNDLAYQVDEKIQDLLPAGVRLVWVVNPETKMVKVQRVHGPGTILGEADELDGEDVLAGFRCLVADLFRLPAGANPTPAADSA
jgi:Uma2 family endonuclease